MSSGNTIFDRLFRSGLEFASHNISLATLHCFPHSTLACHSLTLLLLSSMLSCYDLHLTSTSFLTILQLILFMLPLLTLPLLRPLLLLLD